MYARSTTIQGQPSSIDAGIAHARDSVMPALEGIDGCVGLSLLVDRTSGRCIVTSSWESEEAMRASEEAIRPIRDRAAELLGGSRQVEEWEIAAMHREHRASEGAVSEPPGSRSIRIRSTEASNSIRGLSCPRSRSWTASAVPACSSTGRPAVAFPRRPWTAPKRWRRTRTSWTGSEPQAARKHAQRCSMSATSSWHSLTCVCPTWPDRRTSAARLQVERPSYAPAVAVVPNLLTHYPTAVVKASTR